MKEGAENSQKFADIMYGRSPIIRRKPVIASSQRASQSAASARELAPETQTMRRSSLMPPPVSQPVRIPVSVVKLNH